MILSILYQFDTLLLSAVFFTGIILFYFLGLKTFQYKKERTPTYEPSGIGPFEGAMLGLISLILAFTFNQSASNYELRKAALIHESNCIGTALLRADIYSDSVRQAFRNDFKSYINERIHYYEVGENEKEIIISLQKASLIAEKIWSRTALIAQKDEVVIKSMQMVPAVNDMIDAMGEREEARNTRIPESIIWLLLFLCVAGSFIVGYATKSKKPDWIILCSYSLITVLTIYLILDLDQPRYGVINMESRQQNMYNLLNYFNENK